MLSSDHHAAHAAMDHYLDRNNALDESHPAIASMIERAWNAENTNPEQPAA